jgi:undecaprenyl pyrophosphate synthase
VKKHFSALTLITNHHYIAPGIQMSFKEKIDQKKLPVHIAVIMDGNGRWAKQQGMARIFGHRNGVDAVRDTVEACAELGNKIFNALCILDRELEPAAF